MSSDEANRMESHFRTVFEKLDGLADRMARQETLMGIVQSRSSRCEDHEKRIGGLEGDKKLVIGAAAGVGAGGGGLIVALTKLFGG